MQSDKKSIRNTLDILDIFGISDNVKHIIALYDPRTHCEFTYNNTIHLFEQPTLESDTIICNLNDEIYVVTNDRKDTILYRFTGAQLLPIYKYNILIEGKIIALYKDLEYNVLPTLHVVRNKSSPKYVSSICKYEKNNCK